MGRIPESSSRDSYFCFENRKLKQCQWQVERCDLLALLLCKMSNADAPGEDEAGDARFSSVKKIILEHPPNDIQVCMGDGLSCLR